MFSFIWVHLSKHFICYINALQNESSFLFQVLCLFQLGLWVSSAELLIIIYLVSDDFYFVFKILTKHNEIWFHFCNFGSNNVSSKWTLFQICLTIFNSFCVSHHHCAVLFIHMLVRFLLFCNLLECCDSLFLSEWFRCILWIKEIIVFIGVNTSYLNCWALSQEES